MKDLPLKDRAYVMRIRRAGVDKDEFIPVSSFTVETYKCGLKVGDTITLRRDTNGYRVGDQFTVLTGAEIDPDCVWTLDPFGKTCEWPDTPEIHELFSKLPKA